MQINLNFDGGLLVQFPEFRDVVAASVYGCGRALKSVAADIDMTSSELSRKLTNNPNDPVNFPLHLLPALIEATGDHRPLHWLIEKFCDTPAARHQRTVDALAALMPQIQSLLVQAKVGVANG